MTATERAEEALLEFDREMGSNQGNRNDLVNNVNEVERPAGNSAQAGIRRLRKAADAGDERAGELLAATIDRHGNMTIHRPRELDAALHQVALGRLRHRIVTMTTSAPEIVVDIPETC